MKLKEAKEITGGLSNPSKMPGYSYNLPAEKCKAGSKLYKVEGTVCSHCYARKGRYQFPNVKEALMRRYESITNPKWTIAMCRLISHYCKDVPYFRFHDSGDIQDVKHLENIVTICKSLNDVKFWLPTLEMGMILDYFKDASEIPENLNIRVSCANLDKVMGHRSVVLVRNLGLTVSSVSSEVDKYPESIVCQASKNHTDCGDCRKCWNKDVQHIVYAQH